MDWNIYIYICYTIIRLYSTPDPSTSPHRSHRSRRSPRSFTAAMTLFASAASEMIVSAMVMRWLKSATPVFRATDGDREKGGPIRGLEKFAGKIDGVRKHLRILLGFDLGPV